MGGFPATGRQQHSFPLFIPVCAGSDTLTGWWEGCAKLQHSFHKPCIETMGWSRIAALRILKGNAFLSPVSLKAINIGMTWSLFINPQCRWLGTAGQKERDSMERGSLFALMVVTCCSGSKGSGWGHGPFQCQRLHHLRVLVTLQQITAVIGKVKHRFRMMLFKHKALLWKTVLSRLCCP